MIWPFDPSSFSVSYRILNNPSVIVDLPLPVLPTIPIFDLDLISNDIFFMTVGS